MSSEAVAESVRAKLERALRMVEHSRGYDMRPLITEALTALSEMERDHEAMEKLRGVGRKIDTKLHRYHDSGLWYFYDSGAYCEQPSVDPADAILGKKGETSG